MPPDDPALAAGFCLRPTVMRAAAGDRVCREEDCDPFVTVTTFSGEDEAVALPR